MTHGSERVLPLVRAVPIEPGACLRTALAMAELHDVNGGVLKASMASLAALVGVSVPQVRKCVHSLIARGVLEVTANAHGGAPGAVPHYRFNELRLRALAQQPGHTSDLFQVAPPPRMSFFAEDDDDVRQQMAIELHGRPGRRTIQFYLMDPEGDIGYGWTPLQSLLLPPFAKGAWTGRLNPDDGAPAWALPVSTSPTTAEELRHWVQSVALGRVESIETA